MADLITTARAKYAINQSSFTTAENTTLDALVTAVSKAVRKRCHREFDSQTFDDLANGRGDAILILPQYPLLSVSRVAGSPRNVLFINNTSSANQRATVAVTATGLSLVRVASGSSSTDTTVTWSGNATLQAVADAVNALGNGWSARLPDSTYALWPSADLRAIQGALNAKGEEAGLLLHLDEINDYVVDAMRGWLIRSHGNVWQPGVNNYRVTYTAGHSTVPEDVQEACAQWVAALFWATKENPAAYPSLPHPSVDLLLAPYRRMVV